MTDKNECPFGKGDYVVFKGYGDDASGELTPGEVVQITAVNPEDDTELTVKSLATGAEDSSFYPEEVEHAADDEAVQAILAEKGSEEASEEEAPAEEPAAAKPAAKPAAKKTVTAKKPATKAKTTAKKPAAKKPAATKAKAPVKTKVKPGAVEPIEIVDTDAVAEALEEAGDALQAAEAVVGRISTSYFTLGGILLHIERDSLHVNAGYDDPKKGFHDYVSTQLGLEYRQARYYMQMYQRFTHLEIDEALVASVGWTKAREVLSLPDKEATEAALEYAKEHTRDEVVSYVRDQTVNADKSAGKKSKTQPGASAKAKKTAFKFSLLEENAETAKAAIAKAGEMTGSDDVSENMLYILTEWAEHLGGVDIPMDQAIENLQVRYGIEVEVTATDIEHAPAKGKAA
jgi:chemotaxis protein histidine kinase CheA